MGSNCGHRWRKKDGCWLVCTAAEEGKPCWPMLSGVSVGSWNGELLRFHGCGGQGELEAVRSEGK
ncbi:hypothetical protein NC653_039705 [Populus alba x Populus x berolinensis]|uniref:Uncharacterized protein n=1 Tax=Populus alba x Populus x berolinensis TaxID=444605 RepID=A0AAD6LBW4_9ROSI|nr:hypothetical protein NC653_039705 [Populus alba x Populus x berolinensis]